MAQLALTLVGNAIAPGIGGFIGGALGGLIDQRLFSETQHTAGPRLEDTGVSLTADGRGIPASWGKYPRIGALIESDSITAEPQTTSTGGKGPRSSSHTSYTHVVTVCAFSLGVGPGTVAKLKINKKPVYDVSADSASVQAADVQLAIYDGTQTLPDADLVALRGEGNVPAYTRQIVAVFRDWSVDVYGNPAAALVEAVVIVDPADAVAVQTTELDTANGFNTLESRDYDPSRQLMLYGFGASAGATGTHGEVYVYEPYSRRVIWHLDGGLKARLSAYWYTFADPDDPTAAQARNNRIAVLDDHIDAADTLKIYDAGSFALLRTIWLGTTWGFRGQTAIGSGFAFHSASGMHYYDGGGNTVTTTLLPADHGFSNMVRIDDERLLVLLHDTAANKWVFSRYTIPVLGGSGTFSAPIDSGFTPQAYSFGNDPFYSGLTGLAYFPADDLVSANEVLWVVDATGQFIETIAYDGPGGQADAHWYDEATGKLYSHGLGEITVFDPVTQTSDVIPYAISSASGPVFHAGTGRLIVGDADGRIHAVRLHNYTSASVAAAAIITETCAAVGIPAARIDVTDIDDTVTGYGRPDVMTARALLEGLLPYCVAIGAQAGGRLRFVHRGGPAVATLALPELGARLDGELPQEPLPLTLPKSSNRPSTVALDYLLDSADGERASTRDDWYYAGYTREVLTTVPVVMSADKARQLAAITRDLIYEQITYPTLRLMPTRATLSGGDVVTLTHGTDTRRALLTQVTRSPSGVIEAEAIADDDQAIISAAQGGGGRTASQIATAGPANLIIFDGPLLRDQDSDHIGKYFLAFTYSVGFLPAAVYRSPDDETYTQIGQLGTEAVVGQTQTIPSTVPYDAYDDTNVLALQLYEDRTLEGFADAALEAGEVGAWAWGTTGRWEILQVGTVTLTGERQWQLSHLLRGRRGTDWAMELHQAGDRLVRLDPERLLRETLAVADSGTARQYKIAAGGAALADLEAVSVVSGNAPLRPYSVAQPTATFDAGNDLIIDGLRRTRRGGALGGAGGKADGIGGPISEQTEAYEADIFDEAQGGVLLRTLSATALPLTYAYSAQQTDAADISSALRVALYQLSAAVGRGYASEAIGSRTIIFTNRAIAANITSYLGNLVTPNLSNPYDGDDTTDSDSRYSIPSSSPCWTGVQFASAYEIRRVAIRQAAMSGTPVTYCYIAYSDDGTAWTQGVPLATTPEATVTHNIPAYGAHLYWRVWTDDPNATGWWRLDTVELLTATVSA